MNDPKPAYAAALRRYNQSLIANGLCGTVALAGYLLLALLLSKQLYGLLFLSASIAVGIPFGIRAISAKKELQRLVHNQEDRVEHP